MRIVLFGCGAKATAVLQKLIDLNQEVVAVIYAETDSHENLWYECVQDITPDYLIPTFDNTCDVTDALQRLKPDVIFVVGWRYKIPKGQYSIPTKGTIVFHDSLLPRYRGFAPMNWAIINGETKTGATMFYIDEGIDSGDIIGQAEIPITEYDDAKDVETKVTKAYIGLLETYLPLIKADRVNRKPQDQRQATYCCKRIPDDGLVDWSKTTRQILNLIRGLAEPYPCAFTYMEPAKLYENKLFVLKASLDTEWNNYVGRIPGRVVGIVKGTGVCVLTGDGTLIIKEVGINGKHMRADDVIKSVKTTLKSIDK